MEIIVDDRESNAGVLEHLQAIETLTVEVRRLSIGDYLIDRRVVFERKTLHDLAISIIDGRLFNQACRLVSCPYRPVYIIEGQASDMAVSGIRREAYQGAVIGLTVLFNLPLLRSNNAEETARLIGYAAGQMDRTAKGALYRPGSRPKGKRKRQLHILQGLPGVGPERAARLLDMFGSVEAVFCARKDDLSQVEGVGQKTAGIIRELLTEKWIPGAQKT